MRLSALALLFIVAAPVVISASNEEELIQSLPGADFELNFKHYSGFLQASDTHFLHYWFVESQGNPQKDPLLFWFNGGPGCSSLDGLLNEMGPYLVNPDGKTLRQNPYSWNKFASVVYIESPAGVGFSYSTDGNTTTDDDQTSLESYNAIKQFFGKFPEFRDRPTFITGESYGGVYVPTLTARIIDGQEDFKINLKGVAIGNGYVNADLNVDTSARFAYGHGLVDEMTWNMLEVECCRGCIDGCDLSALTGHCNQVVQDIFTFIWSGGLNPYDIYRECEPNPDLNGLRKRVLDRAVLPSALFSRLYDNSTLTINTLKKKDNDKKKKNKTDRVHHHHHHQEQKLNWPLLGSGSVPCLNDTDVTAYINSAEVRDALHIPDHLGRWTICSDEISTNYIKVYGNMAPFVKKILKARVRILLYYGDTDMACNFLLGQQFSARLGLKRLLNKQIWKYNKQIAGFKTMYSRGLTYLTVRGAGHMAPQWRAPEMDYAISQFLLNHNI